MNPHHYDKYCTVFEPKIPSEVVYPGLWSGVISASEWPVIAETTLPYVPYNTLDVYNVEI